MQHIFVTDRCHKSGAGKVLLTDQECPASNKKGDFPNFLISTFSQQFTLFKNPILNLHIPRQSAIKPSSLAVNRKIQPKICRNFQPG